MAAREYCTVRWNRGKGVGAADGFGSTVSLRERQVTQKHAKSEAGRRAARYGRQKCAGESRVGAKQARGPAADAHPAAANVKRNFPLLPQQLHEIDEVVGVSEIVGGLAVLRRGVGE